MPNKKLFNKKMEFKPTISFKPFYADLKKRGILKEDVKISVKQMLAAAGVPNKLPALLTFEQHYQLSRALIGHIHSLRKKMANGGLYIAKEGNTYRVYRREENINIITRRLKMANKLIHYSNTLMINTPLKYIPNKLQRIRSDNKLMAELSKWL